MFGQAAYNSFGNRPLPLGQAEAPNAQHHACMHDIQAAQRPSQYRLLVSILVLVAASLSYWCMLCSLPRSTPVVPAAYLRRPLTRSMAYKGYGFEVTGKV